jgi:hypothetical protein
MDVIRNTLIAAGALPPDGLDKKQELYYPLFPEEKTEKVRKVYLVAHEKLMDQMRTQMRKKNKRGIEQTGKKLHRLRKKYRARFAA